MHKGLCAIFRPPKNPHKGLKGRTSMTSAFLEKVFRVVLRSRIADWMLKYRFYLILAAHVVLFTMSFVGAFLLRFDFRLDSQYAALLFYSLPVVLAIRLLAFAYWRLYHGWWRYVSIEDLEHIVKAIGLSSAFFLFLVTMIFGHGFPRSILLIDGLLCI